MHLGKNKNDKNGEGMAMAGEDRTHRRGLGGEAPAMRRWRVSRGSTTGSRLRHGDEVSVAVEQHGGGRFRAEAECAARQERSNEEDE